MSVRAVHISAVPSGDPALIPDPVPAVQENASVSGTEHTSATLEGISASPPVTELFPLLAVFPINGGFVMVYLGRVHHH